MCDHQDISDSQMPLWRRKESHCLGMFTCFYLFDNAELNKALRQKRHETKPRNSYELTEKNNEDILIWKL